MKIKLTKPLPQIGRVVPAGAIVDAPEPLMERLVRSGGAEWATQETSVENDTLSANEEEVKTKRSKRGR